MDPINYNRRLIRVLQLLKGYCNWPVYSHLIPMALLLKDLVTLTAFAEKGHAKQAEGAKLQEGKIRHQKEEIILVVGAFSI